MDNVENVDIESLAENLEKAKEVIETWVPMFEQYNSPASIDYAIEVLKAQHKLIDELFEAQAHY